MTASRFFGCLITLWIIIGIVTYVRQDPNKYNQQPAGGQNPYGTHVCNDGWISHSDGPGTCSWHGGVAR